MDLKEHRPNAHLDAQYILKMVVVGDHLVGKSTFLERMVMKKFKRNTKPTIGIDFHVFMMDDTKLQVWDLSGQKRFRAITEEYFKQTSIVILCYSDDVKQSKQHIFTEWLPLIKEKAKKGAKCYIVKLKADTESEDDADDREEWVSEGYQYFKISARRNSGYKNLFDTIVSENENLKVYIGKEMTDSGTSCCRLS